jgi:hypothetical protein
MNFGEWGTLTAYFLWSLEELSSLPLDHPESGRHEYSGRLLALNGRAASKFLRLSIPIHP